MFALSKMNFKKGAAVSHDVCLGWWLVERIVACEQLVPGMSVEVEQSP